MLSSNAYDTQCGHCVEYRMMMSTCLRYTQYGVCVLPTGIAVVPMLMLYLVWSFSTIMMSKCFRYTQYGLCVIPTVVVVVPMLTQYLDDLCIQLGCQNVYTTLR